MFTKFRKGSSTRRHTGTAGADETIASSSLASSVSVSQAASLPSPASSASKDKGEDGLLQFNIPQAVSPEPSFPVDIIAVHGFNGRREKTWTAKNGILWLRDLLPSDLPGARIYSYGYNSKFFSSSKANLDDFARGLLTGIACVRESKEALAIAHEDPEQYAEISKSVSAIIFFGTPHQGSFTVDRLRSLISLADHWTPVNIRGDLLKQLQIFSNDIFTVNQSFRSLAPLLTIISFYELEPVPPLRSLASALMNIGNEDQIPCNSNHRTICRFSSRDSVTYSTLCSKLKAIITQVQKSKLERIEVRKELARTIAELTAEESDCLCALKTSDYETHRETIEKAVSGTCTWLLCHRKYLSFLESASSRLLWVSGSPGSGKSVLSSFLVRQLELEVQARKLDATICFFFCDDKVGALKTAEAILCGLLHQLIQAKPSLIQHALKTYKATGLKLNKERKPLWDILLACHADPASGNVILVVDALDECEESSRQALLKWLVAFAEVNTSSTHYLKIIITSRPEFPILRAIGKVREVQLDTTAEQDSLREDIRLVVSKKLLNCEFADDVKDDLARQLMDKAEGTFLYVALMLRLLEESGDTSPEGANTILNDVGSSSELFDVYAKILGRITNPRLQKQGVRALKIIVAAVRPLHMLELNTALAGPDAEDRTDGEVAKPSRRYRHAELEGRMQRDLPKYLLSVCGPLVRIVKGEVYLAHQTVKEFLLAVTESSCLQLWHFSDEDAHLAIAQVCISYLLLLDLADIQILDLYDDTFMNFEALDVVCDEFEKWMASKLYNSFSTVERNLRELTRRMAIGGTDVTRNVSKLMDKYPFLNYSTEGWCHHLSIGETLSLGRSIMQDALELHECKQPLFAIIIQPDIEKTKDHGVIFNNRWPPTTAILRASYLGHELMALTFLEETTAAVHEEDCKGDSIWPYAARSGQDRLLNKLLTIDPSGVNLGGYRSRSPLYLAAYHGHNRLVEVLCAHQETNVNFLCDEQSTALSVAVKKGNAGMVKILPARSDVDIELEDHLGRTALSYAAENISAQVACLLLARKPDARSKDHNGRTPLSHAAEHGNEPLARQLLARDDVEADSESRDGRTSLSYVAESGHEAVVRLLLARDDVKADSKSKWKRTPWSCAAQAGKEAVVRLLLARDDVEVDSKGPADRTPLSYACSRTSWKFDAAAAANIFDLLLAHGANPESVDRHGKSPLSHAAKSGLNNMVKRLLSIEDIVADRKDGRGWTPLAYSVCPRICQSQESLNHGREVVKMLLDRDDVDPNSRTYEGETPLDIAGRQSISWRSRREAMESEFIVAAQQDLLMKGGHYS